MFCMFLLSHKYPCELNIIVDTLIAFQPGFWNIQCGTGCVRCDCDPVGSASSHCDSETGQCLCKPGVGGTKRCDRCLNNCYGFGENGCRRTLSRNLCSVSIHMCIYLFAYESCSLRSLFDPRTCLRFSLRAMRMSSKCGR